jgi:hypothetical protein
MGGARQKLNASYFNGSLFLAVASGWLAQSWLVFRKSAAEQAVHENVLPGCHALP